MRLFSDTWTMTKRGLRHIVRSPDTIITVAAMPVALMLLFVYVFGDSFGHIFSTGPVRYIDFIVPGIVAMTVVSGIAYAAVRLSMDLQRGMVSRFRTMPIAPSSILSGHAVSSLLSNLFSVLLVVLVGSLAGFRSHASAVEWLLFVALTALFTLATTWLAIMFGLLAKTVEGAGAFSYVLLLLVFVSPGFTPTTSMSAPVRAFAEHQPMTPIVDTMRSLLVYGHAGTNAWAAFAWCGGLLVACYGAALRLFRGRRQPTVASQ
ncbi:MAG TPA: ABC transporter permease [Acidimicrobiales bacterium]|nr:ABC transporter permease [Acidimicrobiales bacterium]